MQCKDSCALPTWRNVDWECYTEKSVSSEESDTQPLGKSDSKYNSVESTVCTSTQGSSSPTSSHIMALALSSSSPTSSHMALALGSSDEASRFGSEAESSHSDDGNGGHLQHMHRTSSASRRGRGGGRVRRGRGQHRRKGGSSGKVRRGGSSRHVSSACCEGTWAASYPRSTCTGWSMKERRKHCFEIFVWWHQGWTQYSCG